LLNPISSLLNRGINHLPFVRGQPQSFVRLLRCLSAEKANNTYQAADTFSKVLGNHTMKFGGEFHADQVNAHPIAQFMGALSSPERRLASISRIS
jgi:hypothetical protein